MKIKVCGMRDSENIRQLAALSPDYMGFIFYEKSPRYVGEVLDEALIKSLPREIRKVGVFVNASPDFILHTMKRYDLQYAQLHGQELPEFCRSIRQKGVNVIKAFSLDSAFNFAMLNNYTPHCDLFLFDTKGPQPGGNGTSFDWSVLARYAQDKPFFLSGGIGLHNVDEALELATKHRIYGLDVNSALEAAPGLKDIAQVEQLFARVRVVSEKAEV